MQDHKQRFFWAGGLLGACLMFSPVVGSAQEGAAGAKPVRAKAAKKRAKTTPTADDKPAPPSDAADLPLGVQENLTEAKRLQEQYRREEAARRRAEAEARRKGLPWPPPDEPAPETQPPQPPVSQPPPSEDNPPPQPPVEPQATSPQNNNARNPAEPPQPPPPPADGKTVIRTWPASRKPAKPAPPQ